MKEKNDLNLQLKRRKNDIKKVTPMLFCPLKKRRGKKSTERNVAPLAY